MMTWIAALRAIHSRYVEGGPYVAENAQRFAIGELQRLRVLCISEIGWLDSNTLLGDVKAAGGVP
jgi:hypothetical protein